MEGVVVVALVRHDEVTAITLTALHLKGGRKRQAPRNACKAAGVRIAVIGCREGREQHRNTPLLPAWSAVSILP